jgi:DNA-binding response OmpR family regulator
MTSGSFYQLKLGRHTIKMSEENRVIIIDDLLFRCTPSEYRIIDQLVHEGPVSDRKLMHAAFFEEYNTKGFRCLKRHVENLRSKLAPSGLSIHRISRYGYILIDP